jgi:hypothetical protein
MPHCLPARRCGISFYGFPKACSALLRFHALNADRVMLNLPLTVMLTHGCPGQAPVSISFSSLQNMDFAILINTTILIDRIKILKMARIF